MKLYSKILIIFIITSSCNKSNVLEKNINRTNTKQIVVDVMNVDDEVIQKASKIMNIVEFIPLETAEDVVIGEINKIIVHDDMYIIHDRLANCAIAFNKDGSHKFTITSIGKGVGEYLKIDAITLDQSNNSILIFDNRLRKLLSFDINGNFINENKYNVSIQDISKLDNSILFNTEYLWNKFFFNTFPEQFQLICISPEGKFISKHLAYFYNDYLCQFPRIRNKFSSIKDTVLYIHDVGNQILNILPDGSISERYFIDFGRFSIPFEYEELNTKQQIQDLYKLKQENKFAKLTDFIETTNSICLRYSFNSLIWTFFYSKITNEKVNLPLIFSNKDGIQIPMPISATDTTFISFIDAHAFIQTYEKAKMSKSIRVQDLFATITHLDNPILIITKMHDNFEL